MVVGGGKKIENQGYCQKECSKAYDMNIGQTLILSET